MKYLLISVRFKIIIEYYFQCCLQERYFPNLGHVVTKCPGFVQKSINFMQQPGWGHDKDTGLVLYSLTHFPGREERVTLGQASMAE